MWNLAGPGIKLVSPALAGRLLTTGPAGRSGINKRFYKTVPFASLILLLLNVRAHAHTHTHTLTYTCTHTHTHLHTHAHAHTHTHTHTHIRHKRIEKFILTADTGIDLREGTLFCSGNYLDKSLRI